MASVNCYFFIGGCMASCIQQHNLKCFEQPCIDTAPFSLCKPHLLASALQLQQTETGPNTEQRIKCQHNIVQYMYIYSVQSEWS